MTHSSLLLLLFLLLQSLGKSFSRMSVAVVVVAACGSFRILCNHFSLKETSKGKRVCTGLKVIENKVINDLVVVERESRSPVKKMERQVSQN